MKKSKKILATLLLSASMFLVPTVVFASENTDVIIDKWEETDDGWKAIDVNGNYINRGWAKSENEIWYYFNSGYMLADSFVTYAGEKYYLGSDGAMHTGWLLFDEDKEVGYNMAECDNVADAFNITTIGQSKSAPFSEDNNKSYEKLWFYFAPDGKMASDEWIKVNDLWYYMDGPVCLINEWSVELPIDNGSDKTEYYGFGGNGNMHIGWISAIKTKTTPSTGDGPYMKDEVNTDYIDAWVYYDESGAQAKRGWKKLNGDWFYFVDNDTYGTAILTNTLLNVDGYNVFLDKDGYMVTGKLTLSAKDEDKSIDYKVIEDAEVVTSSAITIKKDTKSQFLFNDNGTQVLGVKNDNYYVSDKELDSIYELLEENVSTNEITATKKDLSDMIVGTKLTDEFFYIDDKNNIYYFYNGKMVKNDIIDILNVSLAVNKDGHIVNLNADEYITINGKKYIPSDYNTKLFINGITINGVMKK